MDYIAIIHKDSESDYGVSFPDFSGCVTGGTSVDEAKDMAIEALNFHIEGLREDGVAIPSPSSLEDISKHPDFADGFAFLVSAQTPNKTVRINITLNQSDLETIDAAAASAGMKRSNYLVKAGLEMQH